MHDTFYTDDIIPMLTAYLILGYVDTQIHEHLLAISDIFIPKQVVEHVRACIKHDYHQFEPLKYKQVLITYSKYFYRDLGAIMLLFLTAPRMRFMYTLYTYLPKPDCVNHDRYIKHCITNGSDDEVIVKLIMYSYIPNSSLSFLMDKRYYYDCYQGQIHEPKYILHRLMPQLTDTNIAYHALLHCMSSYDIFMQLYCASRDYGHFNDIVLVFEGYKRTMFENYINYCCYRQRLSRRCNDTDLDAYRILETILSNEYVDVNKYYSQMSPLSVALYGSHMQYGNYYTGLFHTVIPYVELLLRYDADMDVPLLGLDMLGNTMEEKHSLMTLWYKHCDHRGVNNVMQYHIYINPVD